MVSDSSQSVPFDGRDPAVDARRIWQAGVAAVDSAGLVRQVVQRRGNALSIAGAEFAVASIGRLIVVGAGKASAGMARGLEQALGPDFVDQKVIGWVNVPGDCVVPLRRIHLHNARPAGVNEPTAAGVAGSQRILDLVCDLRPDDLCLILISGGGSALLPLPVPGITLADKLAMTRTLSRHGATIQELNTVRKRLSRIKGGGLLRAAPAGHLIALIISDVVGDPLDVIASGPTICDHATADDALAVLRRFQQVPVEERIPQAIWAELERQSAITTATTAPRVDCQNSIIGNNQTALSAAVQRAIELGYDVQSLGSDRQGIARGVGIELAELCRKARPAGGGKPVCFIGGGEPVVELATTDRPRKGGRNQEVALSALCHLWQDDLSGIAILSGGTDGEDGPTDAAGAVCSHSVREAARALNLDPFDALSINNSYPFFAATQGLLKTGPTHTNVMDLQVAVIHPGTS
ncbi:MAG: DUF4147 domain-containing protein [Planctomycetes bacterium]|nr:DUF4147 domain-containing protein [Planctomycetota bacterium]